MAADLTGALSMIDVEELERQFRSDSSPHVYIPLGEAYLRRGFPLKAIAVAQKGLKSDDRVEGRLLLAKAYFDASAVKRAFLKKAAEEIDQIVRSHPQNWEGFRLKGEIALERDELQEAIQALQQAHALNPKHPQARMLLKSLNIEVQEPSSADGPFYINVDTDFPPPRTDSLFKTFRDIFIILALTLGYISYLAGVSIEEKRTHGLIFLGRTQQKLDTLQGLDRAKDIYKTVLQKFAPNDPFSLIHLAETHYALYQRHERKSEHLDAFRNYFQMVQSKGPKKLLSELPEYHALLASIEYQAAIEEIAKGNRDQAKSKLEQLSGYLNKYKVELPIHVRLNWIHGLIYEALGNPRYAKAQFNQAAELGWDSPFYRWRLGYYHLRQREFSAAHTHFAKAEEQAKQNVSLVQGILAAPDKQRNEYCWVDPPMLLGSSAPPGLQLSTVDLLSEAFVAAMRSSTLSNCPYHSAIQNKYAANAYYVLASVGDAISVLDAGVGMSVGFKMIRDLKKTMDKIEKLGDMSSHSKAWYHFALAKGFYYQFKYKEGLEAIAEAEKLAPYEPYIQSLYGVLLFKTEKWDEGMQRVKKAIQADPLLTQAYYESAETLLSARDKDGKPSQDKYAEEVLDLMKKTFGDDQTDYLYLKGRLTLNKGDKKVAEETWKKALDDQKAPYFGDHYESNLEMGKLWASYAAAIPKDKEFKTDEYADLHKQFKANLDKINKKLDDRIVKKEDNDAEKAKYKAFLEKLAEGKRVPAKEMELRIGDLREVYDETAGAFFQAAMQTRPGAVEPRLLTGMIYYDNGSYADSTGHFTIAAKGYLRDLDFKNAELAFTRLATAMAFQNYGEELKKKKTWKRIALKLRKEVGEKVGTFFRQQADLTLREQFIKLKTTKKKQADVFDKAQAVQTLELIANVVENHKESEIDKQLLEELREDIKVVKEKGFLEWGKVFEKRMKEKAEQAKSGGNNKRRGRGRRRNR